LIEDGVCGLDLEKVQGASWMFLIGQYDSPFVRRTAIALKLYGIAFEHRPWSTFGDADKIAPYNPLRRVPTLVLDNGEALIESTAILDYLDELVGEARAMIATRGPERRKHLKICALATGLGDKSVSLVYERVLRFTGEAHPHLFTAARHPALAAHAARCEALPTFQEIMQPLAPPGEA